MLEQRRAPHGLGMFLRAAHVAEADRDNVLLELPSGPGLEKLSGESTARRSVQDTLSELLGRPIALSVRSTAYGPDGAAGAGQGADGPSDTSRPDDGAGHAAPADRGRRGRPQPPQRITPEGVKAEKLARLTREDAGLDAAVRNWDLELLD
jgi:hypothetical protein